MSNNTQLMYVNLSNNQLCEEDRLVNNENPFWEDFNAQVKKRKGKKKKRKKAKLDMDDFFDEEKDRTDLFDEKLNEHAKFAIECICSFLRRNINLIHLDLSNTGLSEKQLWYFGRALRRTKSLRAIHLNGNPGITSRLLEYLRWRAHCQPEDKENFIDFTKMPTILEIRDFVNRQK
mmetsp:Transcript_33923/g.52238  ORF Transcript_33923/g.52238 Transcript_33923/m.52238 type:complete len:176 (+) Transcript_33923:195-722(+)